MIKRALLFATALAMVGCSSAPDVSTYKIGHCELAVGSSIIESCGKAHYIKYRKIELKKAAAAAGYQIHLSTIEDLNDGQNKDVLGLTVSIIPRQDLFRSGSYEVTRENYEALETFLKAFVSTKDVKSNLIVIGHTDAVGDKDANQQLSEKRADKISMWVFSAKIDQPDWRGNDTGLISIGAGETQPIAPNSTPKGRQQNRRFEIVEAFNLTPIKMMSNEDMQKVLHLKLAQTTVNPSHLALNRSESSQVTRKSQKKVVHRDTNPLKLKGDPYVENKASADLMTQLGVYHEERWFGLVNEAIAMPPLSSCASTPPPSKSESKGKSAPVHASLPALFKTTWFGKANAGTKETLVVVGPVQIERSDYRASTDPTMSFLLNYHDPKQKPDYTYSMKVQTVKGQDAVLYRLYPKEKNAKVLCADLLFHNSGENETKRVDVFYESNGHIYQKSLQLSLTL
ncbi:OmpA family protein [Vibrio sp. 1180_3]|uniref:OmpA family protein n=1 Tax=Vibrio sp. 1180_3 TaxID=2528832 RepID=UPI0024060566|nr:OmpA family protein [Vibrio sp. 1180_3]MDF9399096.1 OmpA family protein [Vibrio sp. 1180_3]